MNNIKISKNFKKIKVRLQGSEISVKGPLGDISHTFDFPLVYCKEKLNFFIEKTALKYFLNTLKNLFRSVTLGWFIELNLNGIGYKSFKIGKKIALDLGYSNLILYEPSAQLKIKNLKNKIVLFGIDKSYLNTVAKLLKCYATPDPYKGKGLLYRNETLKLKQKSKK